MVDFASADWGDVPTWLATVGAISAAFWAARAYSLERARDRRAAALADQVQASRIAVWADDRATITTEDPEGPPAFWYRNTSDLPVYAVTVFSYVTTADPQGMFSAPASAFHLDTVAPDEAARRQVTSEDVESGYWLRYGLEFRDAAGRWWHRAEDGILKSSRLPDSDEFTVQSLPVE